MNFVHKVREADEVVGYGRQNPEKRPLLDPQKVRVEHVERGEDDPADFGGL